MNDYETSCAITRGAGSTFDFFQLNAFLTPASKSDSEVINAKGFLENHIDMCSLYQSGLFVNLVIVDFWSLGDLPELVQTKNKALVEGN